MAHLQCDKDITAFLVIDPYNDLVVKRYHRDKLSRLALEVRWPHTPSAVPTGRHRSRHVGTFGQEGPGGRSPPSAWPAARDVLRRPMVGGHRAGESVGIEPAPGRSSSSAPPQEAPRAFTEAVLDVDGY